MLAMSQDIQAAASVIKYEDLSLPGIGIYDPGIVLLLKGKPNNDDFVVLGWRGLMLAVINQAKIDASKGDQEAIEWLKSDQCYDICYSLGFEHANILDWLKRGKLKQ